MVTFEFCIFGHFGATRNTKFAKGWELYGKTSVRRCDVGGRKRESFFSEFVGWSLGPLDEN